MADIELSGMTYSQLMLDLKVYGVLISEPQLPLDELKELLYEEYKQSHDISLDSRRYTLSDIVSTDFNIEYTKQLELIDGEEEVNFDELAKEQSLDVDESYLDSYLESPVSFDDLPSLTDEQRKVVEDTYATVEVMNNTVDESVYEEPVSSDTDIEDSTDVDALEDDSYGFDLDAYTESIIEVEDSEDIEYEDSEDIEYEDSEDIEYEDSEDIEYEDSEDMYEEPEYEGDAVEVEADASEEVTNEISPIAVGVATPDINNSTDVNFDEQQITPVSEIKNTEELQHTNSSNKVTQTRGTIGKNRKDVLGNEVLMNSSSKSKNKLKNSNKVKAVETNGVSNRRVEVPKPPILKQNKAIVVEEKVNLEEEPKDLREFLRKHPRSDISFVLKYFSKERGAEGFNDRQNN